MKISGSANESEHIEAKKELLALLLEEEGFNIRKTPVIEPRKSPKAPPLSFAQQRLWFLDQLEPARSIYNIAVAYRLLGPLNVTALERSLNEIVRRHEVLRTTFTTADDQPLQVISSDLTFTVQVVDLQNLPATEPESEVQRFATEEARRPFNLSKGLLLRASLLRLTEEDHVFLLTMHHIVSDGWSMDVFFRELSILYEAFCLGKPSPLPELPIQYADFAVWQRQWLQGEVLEKQLAYWRQQLGGVPPVLELPSDRPRPVVQTYKGARKSFNLRSTLVKGLKALSHNEGATLFMTLLAAFKILLHRYTAQDDIVIGSPIANRNRREIEGLIGFFVNTLVMRTDLSGEPGFREHLERVRKLALQSYAHQDLPFEKLVEELQPERNLSRSPLFQVMFALQNALQKDLELSGLSITPLEVDTGTTKFDLSLSMWETVDGIRGALEYSTDLFDKDPINRMIGHFKTLLGSIVASPDQTISRLPILTQAERKQLLVEWNDTQSDFSKDSCFQELFEDQVDRTPDASAVVYEDERLTYKELNFRANQLAHYLKLLGVGPNVVVGIFIERSVEMIIGLLGILKAGGAYLPLDTSYPKERLAFMLEDTKTSLILTQQTMISKVPTEGLQACCLDTDSRRIFEMSHKNPIGEVTSENLAYVIYTSGSTGKPKGTMIPHRGLVNYLKWCIKTYPVAKGGSVPVFSSLAFDITITGLFAPLLVGLKVLLVPETVGMEGVGTALCNHKDCSLIKLTPMQLKLLSHQVQDIEVVNLTKAMVIGGEALLSEHINFWKQTAPNIMLFNEYGPTETAVGCSVYKVPIGINYSGSIPIGRPIANTKLFILDKHLQPVPVGVQGELYIGGAGLAWGYVNRPDLTAEKFIPNPFTHNPGGRLYKTGDLVRYLPDGNIEFIGRIDHQVQLWGYRIELKEIEAMLAQYPGVRDTVVIAREDKPGEKRLVAYVVIKQRSKSIIRKLRLFLKEKLPLYMVPSIFVFLDGLPLTINGKLDRSALPVPGKSRPDLESHFVQPSTREEQVLTDIFKKVLKIEPIGIQDNFFELGGDSILGIQVITRANQAGLRLTLKQLYQFQTISRMVPEAGLAPALSATQDLVTGFVPITPIQHWFFEQNLPEPHHWNGMALFEVRHYLDHSSLSQAVQHLLIHHDALRLRFFRQKGVWVQKIVDFEKNPVFSRIDLSVLPESEHGPVIESKAAELQCSLNLSAGPLLRVVLFDGGKNHLTRLLIVIHHLAIDGVSWRILLGDLQVAYRQLGRGEKVQLPPKTTSFKEWAERLTVSVKSGMFKQEVGYWLDVGRVKIAPLPVDYPGGANTEGSSRCVSVSLSVEETRFLLQAVPKVYRSQINEVLIAAVVQAFSRWTGQQALLLDLEGHGREELFEDVDVSRTVGWFTTIFPVLIKLSDLSDPGAILNSVKEQLRGIPNRGIGYGALRYNSRSSAIARGLRTFPQREVIFNYLGQFDQVLNDTGLLTWTRNLAAPGRSPKGNRSHLLAINAHISGNQLHIDWVYSKELHKIKTIESLSLHFIEALKSLINHCLCLHKGKAGRPGLPPLTGRRFSEKAYTRPPAQLEQKITAIWQEVLHVEKIDVHDNFFDLGGHSLQAMQLVSKLASMMNIDIPVRALFLYPSIADLARAIEDNSAISKRTAKKRPNSAVCAVSDATSNRISGPQTTGFLKIERRSLLSLFEAGKIAPVNSAALGYLPSELCLQTGLTRDEVVCDWCDYLPTLGAIIETTMGRIAIIRLPRLGFELYDDQQELVVEILEALDLAGRLGARTVSLTGLIPSATDYGHAVATAIADQRNLPTISTGHATTAATVVLSIKKILQEAGRNLTQERVGLIGVGSIGRASLRLMLKCLPHPQEIILCDVYSKRDTLEKIHNEIVNDLNYLGSVRIITSHATVSPEFYDATLIIGATNVPGILDIKRMNPGTMMIDDSAPHCFSPEDAVQRFEKHNDILFTEGGILLSPHPMNQLRYLPRSLEQKMSPELVEACSKYSRFQIGGCVLSSLLSSCFENIVPTVGLVDDISCLQNYNLLRQLGFQAANLQCRAYVLEKKSVLSFRNCFGGKQNYS